MQVAILILLLINWKTSVSAKVLIKTMKSQADKKSCYIGICNFHEVTLNCRQNKLPIENKFLWALQCFHHRNRKEGRSKGIWWVCSCLLLVEQFPINLIADGLPKDPNLEKVIKCALTRSHEQADNEYSLTVNKKLVTPERAALGHKFIQNHKMYGGWEGTHI